MEAKKCPYCAEEIRIDAKKCRFCGEFLDDNLKDQRKKEIEASVPVEIVVSNPSHKIDVEGILNHNTVEKYELASAQTNKAQSIKKISKEGWIAIITVFVCSTIHITTDLLYVVQQFTPSRVTAAILTPFIFIYGLSLLLAALAGAFKIDFFKAFNTASIILSIIILMASRGAYMFSQE